MKKNDSPFVIIDGVPRTVLSESIRYAARDVAEKARRELLNVFKEAHATMTHPGGRAGATPEPKHVDAAIAMLQAARDEYATQYAIACKCMERALELDEPEDDPPPPAPEEAEV
jgi:hypothetical protein